MNLLPKKVLLLGCMFICTSLIVVGLNSVFINPLKQLKLEYVEYKTFAEVELVKLKSKLQTLESNLTKCQESTKFNSLVTQRDLMYNSINNLYHDKDESIEVDETPEEGNFTLRL